MAEVFYSFDVPGASHWSFKIRRGNQIRFTDLEGGANLAMLFYNPENLLEKYNAPDTLKCQHTFKLTKGNCLYSDMGRIFCAIVDDDIGWHETVCGNTTKASTAQQWGKSSYQQARNDRQQNGYDCFLVELAKYGLGAKDMAANVNFFSKVKTDAEGNMSLSEHNSKAGQHFTLRFDMDTLVMLHTCPHPLSEQPAFPRKAVRSEFTKAEALSSDDFCLNFRPENQRGYKNNQLYYLGLDA
ncbi:MAG: urea carboxylase-associated family protein [Cellvibrionaceae bacterium]|nr:urea carboxylase-associated family protein [Cellvibrionaceae bacterium]